MHYSLFKLMQSNAVFKMCPMQLTNKVRVPELKVFILALFNPIPIHFNGSFTLSKFLRTLFEIKCKKKYALTINLDISSKNWDCSPVVHNNLIINWVFSVPYFASRVICNLTSGHLEIQVPELWKSSSEAQLSETANLKQC